MDITAVTASPVVLGRWRSRRGVGEESGAGDAGVGRNCSRVLVCKRTDQGTVEVGPIRTSIQGLAREVGALGVTGRLTCSLTCRSAIVQQPIGLSLAHVLFSRGVNGSTAGGVVFVVGDPLWCAARDTNIALLTNQSMVLFTPS